MAEDVQQIYAEAQEAHAREEFIRAVELYAQVLEQFPDADLVLYNQGLALYELGRFAESAAAFGRAADIRHDDADIWFNLGLALKQDCRHAEAIHAYEQALQLQPDGIDVLFNLANCCREGGQPGRAAAYYEQLLDRDPDHVSGLNNFAYLCHRLGEYRRAEELYQRLLKLQPGHPGARHMLAALKGTAETTPSNEYVRDLFDQYSGSFEQSLLEKLEYRAPELLFECLNRYFPDRSGYAGCLDLGCGTGLAGTFFRPVCTTLTGVDLSEKMVAIAREKELYDTLATVDVVQFLRQNSQRHDLIVAADVLTYLADLSPLFMAVARRMRSGGLFVFSTEHGETAGWQIRPTGRFAHHPDYIRELAKNSGAEPVCSEKARLRKEGDDWIIGDLYILHYPDNS